MPDTHDPQLNPQSIPPAQPAHVPNSSEAFGTILPTSATFRTVPLDSEPFGTVRSRSERKESHTLTVREVARMFEAAGVARTERSIVKWCRRVGNEVPRLDSYFDPNERKHYITSGSVERAIAEEHAKVAKINARSEPNGSVPTNSERQRNTDRPNGMSEEAGALEAKIRDLEIASRFKDKVIEHYEKQENAFEVERQGYF